MFHHVWASWAQLFEHGPEQLTLRGTFGWQNLAVADESIEVVGLERLMELGDYQQLEVERDWLVKILTKLADFGEQAMTGQYFITHIGI